MSPRLPLLVSLLLLPTLAAGAVREVRATRTARAPVIDGRLEDLWRQADEITDLQQQRPDNGQAASETTSVWILYDQDALYVGARMHDRQPIVRLLGRRDTFLESDWFGVLLDPQHDRRSGNAFFVNPDGVQYDEVISNDTDEDTSWDGVWQSAVSIDSTGGWSAEMRIPFSQLRFAEARDQTWGLNFIRWIKRRQEQDRLQSSPRNLAGFASRFGDLAGLVDVRPRPKVEMTPYLTAAMNSFGTVAAADPLNDRLDGRARGGLDLRWTSRSSLTAYATIRPDFGQVEVDPAIIDLSQFEQFLTEKRPFFLEGAKLYSFGGLASAYYSPFRLTHPLLFYSRRIGRAPQGNARLQADWIDTPDETTILGAGKLVERTSGGASLALLDGVTEDTRARIVTGAAGPVERAVEPLTNYLAGRWTRDLGEAGRLGALLTTTHRRTEAATDFLPARAIAGGLDGYRWLRDHDVLVDGLLIGSAVDGSPAALATLQRAPAHQFQRLGASHLSYDPTRTTLEGVGGKLAISRVKGTWRYQVQGESYSPGLELNDLGFLPRADVRAAHAMLTYFDVKQRKLTRNNRVSLGAFSSWNQGDARLGNGIAGDAAITFHNYWAGALQAAYSLPGDDDRETRGGPIIRRPEGWVGQLRVGTDTRKPFWLELAQTLGSDAEGGHQHASRVSMTVRPRSNLSTSIVATVTSNVIGSKWVASVPDTSAHATGGTRYVLGRLWDRRFELDPRVDWTLGTNLTFQLFLQPLTGSGAYRDFKEVNPSGVYAPYGGAPFADPDFTLRSLRANAVLRWELQGGTTLFAVWNQSRSERDLIVSEDPFTAMGDLGSVQADDRFLVKLSHRFEVPH